MDITCKFAATRSEIYNTSKFYYSKTGRKWLWWPVGFVALLLGLSLINQGRSQGTGVFMLMYGVFVFLMPAVNAFFVTRNYFSNPNLGGQIEYHLTDEHLDATSNAGSSVIEWKAFSKWAESPDAFLLILYKNYYVIVLKRGFENESQASQFREFLTSKIGKQVF